MINENRVFMDVTAADKAEALKKISELARACGAVTDDQAYCQALEKREDEFCTSMGNGIAIPHGVVKDVEDSAILYVRFQQEIEWDAEEHEMAKVAIALVVPEEKKGNAHLEILAGLARRLMHEDFVEKLLHCDDPKEIAEMLGAES